MITLSIVSHGQLDLVKKLLSDLEAIYAGDFEVILTLNIPEIQAVNIASYCYPLRLLANQRPLGFGANHNQAFLYSKGEYFAVVNPDIRAYRLRLEALTSTLESVARAGACAPLVLDENGAVADSARFFPSFYRLLKRVVVRSRGSDYIFRGSSIEVDWVAGMFVVFKRSVFRDIGGFDSRRFFMYFEDVDICKRMHDEGITTLLQPSTFVVHTAQRASRYNLQHFWWHLNSAIRYFCGK